MRKGELWTRRDVLLADSQQQVTCKLWANKADVNVTVGDKAKISNLTVDLYNNVPSLNSTDETQYEVSYNVITSIITGTSYNI